MSAQLPKPYANDPPEKWRKYWEVQAQEWRTAPEIDEKRQDFLKQRRETPVDIKQGIYPFRDPKCIPDPKHPDWNLKLSRADVKWLLAIHENGQGPVIWNDPSQRERLGVDLRGADLKGVDLSGLPLARMLGGIAEEEEATEKQREMAAVHLEGSDLHQADLRSAELSLAYLTGASLRKAKLQEANLDTAHLEGAKLYQANLEEANLRYAYLDQATNLDSIDLNKAKVADVRWGDVNLALVAWERVKILGDESNANDQKIPKKNGPKKDKDDWLRAYRRAIRANRQVATILRDQGRNEKAGEFDYRAQVLQRKLLFRQGWWRKTGLRTRTEPSLWWSIQMVASSVFSWLLWLVAGYGYKPVRWLFFYLGTVIVFAFLHYLVDMPHPPLLTALFTSVQNLHGHSFTVPSNLQGGISWLEAFFGLFIEAILIAIIAQRILSKSGGSD